MIHLGSPIPVYGQLFNFLLRRGRQVIAFTAESAQQQRASPYQEPLSMADRGNFEEYAAQCIRQARETKIPEQKAMLLMMAQAWRRMAEQTDRVRDVLKRTTGGESR